MYRRGKARRQLILSDDVLSLLDQEMPELSRGCDARTRALGLCVELLPSGDRQLIDARYRPGASTKSVSESLNRSVDAVYRALRRIHETLFNCIRRRVAEEGEA